MERLKSLNGRLTAILVSPRTFLVFGAFLLLYNVLGVIFVECLGESDYWEHLAAIASFARNPIHPSNPYLLSDSPTHLLTPYHFFWGLVSRVFSIAPFHVLPIASAVNTLLFLASVRVFCARVIGDGKWALSMSLAMLFWWINGWPWSGFYFFGLFPSASVYPYWFALPAALTIVARFDPSRGFVNALFCGIGAATVFLVHPITGGFLMLALAARLLLHREVAWPRMAGMLGLQILVYAVGIVAWPFFPVLESILRAPSYSAITFAGDWRMFYDKAFIRIGPSLAGAYWLLRHWREDRTRFLTACWVVCTLLYAGNFFVLHSATVSRLVIFVALAGHLGVVAALAASPSQTRERPHVAAFLAATLVLAIPQFVQSSKEIAPLRDLREGAPLGTHANAAVFKLYSRLGEQIEPGSVVMAPLDESWFIPGIVDCRVVGVHHSNPFMNDFEARQKATVDFFDPRKSDAERWAIVERYRVRYVLLPARVAAGLDTLIQKLDRVAEEGSMQLFRTTERARAGDSAG